MLERMSLRFQKLRIVTLFIWVVMLFLGLMSRGVISPLVFWVLASVFIVFFSIDVVYFIIRVSGAHYVHVTEKEVIIKRVFQPPKALQISAIQWITLVEKKGTAKRIIVSDGEHAIEIKRVYRLSKEIILRTIMGSEVYPEGVKVNRIKEIW